MNKVYLSLAKIISLLEIILQLVDTFYDLTKYQIHNQK